YFIKTAALLAQYDRTWGDSSRITGDARVDVIGKMGDIVNLMVRDVAGYDRRDPRYNPVNPQGVPQFPFLRNFSVYERHSWADGGANDQYGTNQEAVSEALNFASGLIQWGEATGDDYLRNVGIYLYNTELQAFNTYWFNVNKTDAFPKDFAEYDDNGTTRVL